MSRLTHQFLSVALILGAAQLIRSYSYNNCIADAYSKGESFKCINRKANNISAIISDLPSSVTNLTVSLNLLRDIPGHSFTHLPNLQNLRLDQNNVSNIDQLAFRHLHQLHSLNLSFNNISQLDPFVFKGLHNLTYLSLTNNTLKQLPEGIFASNLNLITLFMGQNFLMNFSGIVWSVSHLTSLKTLDLCFNNLTSLSHSNASLPASLKELYLCRNQLTTLGCERSFLVYIRLLDLSYNDKLPTAAFQGVNLKHLNYLRLRSTRVKIVEFLNTSDIDAGRVDFSGTGLSNDSRLTELCTLLNRKVKNITNLQLGSNSIRILTNNSLCHCPEITRSLDLSRNRLRNTNCLTFLNRHRNIKILNVEHNLLNLLQSCINQTKVHVQELSYRYNRILSVSALAFYNVPNIKKLLLNINIIAYLDRNALKGLRQLEELRLDNNLLTDLFIDNFKDNVKLKTLNLRNNRISVIFNSTFQMLSNLTILDLGGNKISHIKPSGLDGLVSLSKLYLDGNNLQQVDSSLYHVFQDTLTTLDLQSNQIRFFKEFKGSPFKNLSKLTDLKLDGQRPHGMTILPSAFFRGLHSLRSLYLTNNNLYDLAPDVFDDLTGLRFLNLDSCCVGVIKLRPGVFKNLRNLTLLVVENMGIQNFSKEVFGNLTQLRRLQMNRNVMQSISVDALQSLPNLNYLDIRNIPLSCTCKNILLQNWTRYDPNVQVVYLYNLLCQSDPSIKFYNFDTKVCFLDLGESMFFCTAAVLFLFTVSPLLYVKLYWKFKYSYYVFRSWFSEQWRRLREEEENCKYDAFISYNSSDEQWVMDQLVPNLEGNGSSFKLCLHHRDFELGRDIVDNIVSAVYSSRKTICVVSRNFLQSEWCSLEIQLASYRLFDEHRDVLLLVFLEPISERKLSSYHRMRKVMLKKTYLQWPGSDCTDPTQAQDLFWNQLRRGIRMESRLETEDSTKCDDKTEHLETSDEKYYLLP